MEEIKALLKALIASNTADGKNAEKEDDKDAKEVDNEHVNEGVDKRKLVDEVAGIMKSAGVDDELIRAAIAKMEKLGYDKSEASTADNKCKNEDEEKEGDEEDMKAKNSLDEQMKAFMPSSTASDSVYISQAKAIELGKELY